MGSSSGLSLWNLLNALVLLASVYYLPRLSLYQQGLILLLVLIELMTSMQSEQSNALIAGLLVWSFGLMERNKSFWAALCIVASAFIKLFGIVGFAIFLFYPRKWLSAVHVLFWTAVFFILPLLFIDLDQYLKLFDSYLKLLSTDHHASYGFSVMGWLHSWFSIAFSKNGIVAIGILIFLLPFYKIHQYREYGFKYLLTCSIPIWIVIFNHKAESPTFIIAMTGVALWFVQSEKTRLNTVLFASAFMLTTLSPTDFFPKYWRDAWVTPYALKVFPCILIWMKIIYDLLALKKEVDSTPQIEHAEMSS